MFTGIITNIGTITKLEKNGDLRATVACDYDTDTIDIGASIAHSGVCLTVIEKSPQHYVVQISDETIACSNIGDWQVESRVNLERALCVGDELGGHIVSGHVDGLAQVVSITPVGDSHEFVFMAPDELKYYIAPKGSVTLDGVSLTVNDVDDNKFSINIISYTFEHTNFNDLALESKVNLEIDTLARYVARLNQAK